MNRPRWKSAPIGACLALQLLFTYAPFMNVLLSGTAPLDVWAWMPGPGCLGLDAWAWVRCIGVGLGFKASARPVVT